MTDEFYRRLLSDEPVIEVRGEDLESVIDGMTGGLCDDPEALAAAIRAVGFVTAVKCDASKDGGISADYRDVITRDWYIGAPPKAE